MHAVSLARFDAGLEETRHHAGGVESSFDALERNVSQRSPLRANARAIRGARCARGVAARSSRTISAQRATAHRVRKVGAQRREVPTQRVAAIARSMRSSDRSHTATRAAQFPRAVPSCVSAATDARRSMPGGERASRRHAGESVEPAAAKEGEQHGFGLIFGRMRGCDRRAPPDCASASRARRSARSRNAASSCAVRASAATNTGRPSRAPDESATHSSCHADGARAVIDVANDRPRAQPRPAAHRDRATDSE